MREHRSGGKASKQCYMKYINGKPHQTAIITIRPGLANELTSRGETALSPVAARQPLANFLGQM